MKTLLKKLLVPPHLEYLALDKDFLIQETSLKVQRFGDCPEEVVAGKDVRIPFPELMGTEEILIDIFEKRLPNFELKAITRVLGNGSRLYFDMYIVEFTNDDSYQRLIIFFEDVTDRMALEQTLVQATNEMDILLSTLAATNNYVEKIITSMAEVLLVTTASGKIKKVNQATQDLFGYSESELVGQQINVLAATGASLQAVSQKQPQQSQTHTEVICTAKTGEKLTVSFSCTPIPTDIKGISGSSWATVQDFVYIGRDVTDRQRARKRQITQYVTTRILSASETIKKAIAAILPVICDSLGWDTAELWMPEAGEKLLSETKRITRFWTPIFFGASPVGQNAQFLSPNLPNLPNKWPVHLAKDCPVSFGPAVPLSGLQMSQKATVVCAEKSPQKKDCTELLVSQFWATTTRKIMQSLCWG